MLKSNRSHHIVATGTQNKSGCLETILKYEDHKFTAALKGNVLALGHRRKQQFTAIWVAVRQPDGYLALTKAGQLGKPVKCISELERAGRGPRQMPIV